MKKAFLSCLLVSTLAISACCPVHGPHIHMPRGNPGEAPSDLDTCTPGREITKHCRGQ